MKVNGRISEVDPIPSGFRPITDEELSKMDVLALKEGYIKERISRFEEKIRAAQSEIKLAQLEKEHATHAMGELLKEAGKLNRSLGIESPDDRRMVNGAIYIRERK